MILRLIALALLAYLFILWSELPEDCVTDSDCGCTIDCLG